MRRRRTMIRKAQPTPGDVHVNVPLTNISVAYMQSASSFVADKVFPVVPVSHQSDLYYEFDREAWLRDEAKPRAPASETAGGGFTLTTKPYACTIEGYHKDLDEHVLANADSQLQLDRAAAEFVTQKLLIRRERRWASSYFTTGVWGTDITPANLWDTAASDPQADVEKARLTLKKFAGQAPTNRIVGVFGAEVMSKLKTNAAIRDHYKYTSNQSLTEDLIARYLGLDEYHVMEAVYASNAEGAALATDFIGGKHLLVAMVTRTPNILTPTAGYTFAWTGLPGSIQGVRNKRFRMEPIASDRIEGEMAFDMKVVAAGMGYFFHDLVS